AWCSGRTLSRIAEPSSGGSGSRLNAQRKTFITRNTDKSVVANVGPPPEISTTDSKLTCSGAMNQPNASPPRMIANAAKAISRLPAGPAAAMIAARPGYRLAQTGSYGQLAHPMAHPWVSEV